MYGTSVVGSVGTVQGLEPYRNEPVLEPESFVYVESKPHRNPYLN